jgi:hypothetical protein
MVANLERVVGTLYEADNIHFPVEHFLTLHTLNAALHSTLANPVGRATSATGDNTAPFTQLQLPGELEVGQIQRENQKELKPKQDEEARGPQDKGGEADGGSMKFRAEKRDHQAMARSADPSVRTASTTEKSACGSTAINHNTENGAIGSSNSEGTTIPKDPKKPKQDTDARNGK